MKRLRWVLIGALVLGVIVRLPSLFEPYSYADEGIYLVLGQGLRKGLVFYRDIHDNKPPLLYVMAGLSQSLMMFRLMLLVWSGVNVWLIWLLGRKMFKDNWKAVLVSCLGFGLLSGLTVFEGNIANGENFMIMPMTAAVYLAVVGMEKKQLKYFAWAGLAGAIGFLFKVPVAFDLLGLGLWLVWLKKKGWFKQLSWLGLGFLIPNLLVWGYYTVKGAGERYLMSALLQNMPYLTSWGGGGGGSIWQSGLFQRGLVVGLVVLLMFKLRKPVGKWGALLGLWFGLGLYGVLLSERPYPHYFLQIVPVLSLLLGLAVVKGRVGKLILGWAMGLTVFSFGFYKFWQYPVKAYYLNFWDWARGEKSVEEYKQYWGEAVLIDEEVGKYIREMTGEDEKIFVWGTAPGIYYLSRRLPVGRYTVSYHIADFDGYEETMEALEKEKPRVIVRLESEGLEFKELEELVASEYVLVKIVGDRRVYLRVGE